MIRPNILLIMALPPPHHGVTIANEILLKSNFINKKYNISLSKLNKDNLQSGGKFCLKAILLDCSTLINSLRLITVDNPNLIYLCIAQTRFGLWRDILILSLAKILGQKCLIHLHGSYFRNLFEHHLSNFEKHLFALALKKLDGAIVLDNSLTWIFEGLVPSEKIFVLRNGVAPFCSTEEMANVQARRSNASPLKITYLSNLVPGKGFNTFLETAALLNKSGKAYDFIFNLAGSPDKPQTATKVEEFVKSNGLYNKVNLLGKIIGNKKWRLLLDSDVFVFPPNMPEGQPWAIIEALAAGLPIISTAQGCIPTMVRDGINGYIVPANNPVAIAESLIRLKNSPSLRLAMGQASLEHYLTFYTEKKFVTGFANIVDQVLARN